MHKLRKTPRLEIVMTNANMEMYEKWKIYINECGHSASTVANG